jgi:hypothetical protein
MPASLFVLVLSFNLSLLPLLLPLSLLLMLQAARLWVHECERVFRDRMVNDTDMAKFDEFRASVTKKYFEDLGLGAVEERPLLFTSFMQVRCTWCACFLCCWMVVLLVAQSPPGSLRHIACCPSRSMPNLNCSLLLGCVSTPFPPTTGKR